MANIRNERLDESILGNHQTNDFFLSTPSYIDDIFCGVTLSHSPDLESSYPSLQDSDFQNFQIPIEKEVTDKDIRKLKIKEKISRAIDRFPDKTKLIQKPEVSARKQKQLFRKRISAQRSREKKNQELILLRNENQMLRTSKTELEEKLVQTTSELEIMNKTVKMLPDENRHEFFRIRELLETSMDETEQWEGRPSRCRGSLLLTGALIGCICLIACISPFVIIDKSAAVLNSVGNTRLLTDNGYIYADHCRLIYESINEFQ